VPDKTLEGAPVTACQKVRDLRESALTFWGNIRAAMRTEREFLSGDRYEVDNGAYNKDRRLVQIRGQEIQDTIRHVAAKATEKPRNIEPRPVDRDDDPDTSEVAASLVEWELGNPWKGFDDCYEAAIIAAREKRLGIVWMDWDPDCGPYGEILYRYGDGEKFMWDQAYDPHHPNCGWIQEERRVDVEWIRKNFKGSDWVKSDFDAVTELSQIRPGIPLMAGSNGERLPSTLMTQKDNKATIWLTWFKNDKTEGRKKEKEDSYEPLLPGERYMSCVSCGHRSETQDELAASGGLDLPETPEMETELPESLPMGCPTCAGDMNRIDAKSVDEVQRAYERGKRLIIQCALQRGPDDKPLYDGKWPLPGARSFPCLVLTAYQKPGMPVGPSDTTLMWDQQVALDQLRTMAIQRIYEHRNYWVLPEVGIKDYKGRRFNFREDQFNVMYRDGSQNFGPMNVELLNGDGLDGQFMNVYNITNSALTQYRGVTDLGITPESSKNIAASTVAQLNQMGEIPVAHFNRRKNRELSKFYGVVWDYIKATYTPDRLARLRIEGVDVLANLSGDDLPNFDFVIADTPDWTGIEKQRSDSFQQLIQVAQTTPQYLEAFATLNNIPRSVLRMIEKAQSQMMPTDPSMMGADAMAGGGPGMGTPPSPEMQPQLGGPLG
jgi:hypothetical protein